MLSDEFILHLATGACRAGRLLGLAALLHALLAVAFLVANPPALAARLLWTGVVLAGAPSLYLAVRLEIDLGVFGRLVDDQTDAASAQTAIDDALRTLALGKKEGTDRPLAERARGAFALLRQLATWLGLQIALSLLAAWIG